MSADTPASYPYAQPRSYFHPQEITQSHHPAQSGFHTPRTITPPLTHTPSNDSVKTPRLTRIDSKMTAYSTFHKSSPITPGTSPRNSQFSPRWQLPASPPSPLTMGSGEKNTTTVVSTTRTYNLEYGTNDRPRQQVPQFKRPPRKSSLCGMMAPFDPTFSSPIPAVPQRARQVVNKVPFRDNETFLPRAPFKGQAQTHESIRSAFSTGTDRSSLFSKVSSIFDPPPRPLLEENVMTVEDAIKMYEDGFDDSSDSSGPSIKGSHPIPSISHLVSRPLESAQKRYSQLRKIKSHDSIRPTSRLIDSTVILNARKQPISTLAPGITPVLRKTKSNGLLAPSVNTTSRLSSELFINDNLSTPTHSPTVSRSLRPALPIQPVRAATMPNPLLSHTIKDTIPTPVVSFTASPSPENSRDRYGFRKESQHVSQKEYDTWDQGYCAYMDRRRRKWHSLMKSNGLSTDNPTVFPPKSERVKRYIRKGIPPEWRGNAWFWYSGGTERLKQMPGQYGHLVVECERLDGIDSLVGIDTTSASRSEAHQTYTVDREHIERDLHRTFPDNVLFKPDPPPSDDGLDSGFNPGGKPTPKRTYTDDSDMSKTGPETGRSETGTVISLRRVLRAFALHKSSIGYCQSLNFLAGLLLIFLRGNEEKTFILLDIITTDHLPGTHARVLEANVDVGVLMDLVRQELPTVWSKIDDSLAQPVPSRADSIKSVSTVGRLRRRVTPSSAVPSLHRLHNRFGGGNTGTIIDQASNTLPTVSLATTSWFMSLFIGSVPIEPVARIWDSFFYEGAKVLFRAGLAIFRVCEPKIRLLQDRMEVFQLVQTVPRSFLDANLLIDACWRRRGGFGRVSRDVVEDRRQQRRQVVRGENEARLDAESSATPSRNGSPLPSTPPPPIKEAVKRLEVPPMRATTVSSPPSSNLRNDRVRADPFRRQATFS